MTKRRDHDDTAELKAERALARADAARLRPADPVKFPRSSAKGAAYHKRNRLLDHW